MTVVRRAGLSVNQCVGQGVSSSSWGTSWKACNSLACAPTGVGRGWARQIAGLLWIHSGKPKPQSRCDSAPLSISRYWKPKQAGSAKRLGNGRRFSRLRPAQELPASMDVRRDFRQFGFLAMETYSHIFFMFKCQRYPCWQGIRFQVVGNVDALFSNKKRPNGGVRVETREPGW
ncbi:hypothetical protein B0T26DRAFT_671968 [Lasiosphaeria miniovina]|uniref:Uncharacterized protein n=1 Tax=Lasiosphaeria miniovina TaxID=1954250 RepID=A0AA40B404_9PEZI|nr:uncharacterized protein B0T26DRAFT_671968 [Lasiosphaeria miniovina]KAK0727285.1 hypothetical protein B0T26DRAFT_671968 [Lasiosphaeria miniovina]